MRQKDVAELLGAGLAYAAVAVIVVIMLALVLGLFLGMYCFVAWVVVGVASGLFGLSLPFWPVVGALWLTTIGISWLSRATIGTFVKALKS